MMDADHKTQGRVDYRYGIGGFIDLLSPLSTPPSEMLFDRPEINPQPRDAPVQRLYLGSRYRNLFSQAQPLVSSRI